MGEDGKWEGSEKAVDARRLHISSFYTVQWEDNAPTLV